MDNTLLYIGIVSAIFVIVLCFVLFKLIHSVKTLNSSFAKLGYVAREDAKRYFGDAADKVVDMNSGFNELYQAMITEAMKKAMSESSVAVEATLVKAEQEAGNIILNAQEQSKQIIEAAKKDSADISNRSLNETVDTISWAMQEYIHDNLSVQEHEDIVMQLVNKYLNERRN